MYNLGGIKYAAQQMDGVFACCVLDTKEKRVHLIRDTYGVKPLFRALSDDGVLCLSSEAKGKHSKFKVDELGISLPRHAFVPLAIILKFTTMPSLKTIQWFGVMGFFGHV